MARMGDPAWKKRERKWLLEDIEYYQDSLAEWNTLTTEKPKLTEEIKQFIEFEEEMLALARKHLRELREGDAVERKWKAKVQKDMVSVSDRAEKRRRIKADFGANRQSVIRSAERPEKN